MTVFSQVKKPLPPGSGAKKPAVVTLKPKITAQAVALKARTRPVAINFFEMNADVLSELLAEKFKPEGIILDDIEDRVEFAYDKSGKATTTVNHSTKVLKFSKSIVANITSDAKDIVYKISFEMASNNLQRYQLIKDLCGIEKWDKVFIGERDTIYSNENSYAFASLFYMEDDLGESKPAYSVQVENVLPYTFQPTNTNEFTLDSLYLTDNPNDVGYGIIQLFQKLGVRFLYKERKAPRGFTGEVLERYSTGYVFENGVSAAVDTSPADLTTGISFLTPNPFLFSKLKKALNLIQWKSNGRNEEFNIDYLVKNNLICNMRSNEKSLYFLINPLQEDIKTRYRLTKPQTLEELLALYNSGTPEEVTELISEQFLNHIKADWEAKTVEYDAQGDPLYFCFKSPNDSLVQVKFVYDLTKNWTAPVVIYTFDYAYLDALKEDYKKLNLESTYSLGDLRDKPGSWKFVLWSREKEAANQKEREETEAANKRAQEEQEAIAAANRERQREEAARLAAEKQLKQAENARKTAEAIDEFNKGLLKLGETMKKKN